MRQGILLTLLAPLMLAACQSTVLESLPTGSSAQCPRELQGAWVGIDEDSGDPVDAGLHVATDCTTTFVELHDGKLRETRYAPRYARIAGSGFLFVDQAEAATQYRRDPPGRAGWHPFQWRRSGGLLKLRPPDHRRIATLIVNGALEGVASWDRDEGENFIYGDAEAIARALAGPVPFHDDGSIRLRRVGENRKALDRAIDRAARDARARARDAAPEAGAGAP